MAIFHLTIKNVEDRETAEKLILESGVDSIEISHLGCLLSDPEIKSAHEMAQRIGIFNNGADGVQVPYLISVLSQYNGFHSQAVWEWLDGQETGK
ncbi:hypothetical protein [Vibrio splendidus]|uniref:hypothetical protein n=1 Tax=Vibrio splendidus TaxID=29497 RepID=UPI000C83A8A2|nr:hypothetical protein [Vibrio splendidus]PMN25933.1 hypothetical protein BCT36_11305 [Vibrio splendidus]